MALTPVAPAKIAANPSERAVRRRVSSALLGLMLFAPACFAGTIPIDLNDFFADPSVTVATDGSVATLTEDSGLVVVILSNDPGHGDPNVILPATGRRVVFEYAFTEGPAGNDDEFLAFVLDAATGMNLGPPYEFLSQASSSGTVAFDLSGLVGSTVGLQFELRALSGDVALDSTVRVSGVRLTSVPEPGGLLLLMVGVLGWAASRRLAGVPRVC